MPTRFKEDEDQQTQLPGDEDLRHITGIGEDEEGAIDREAFNERATQILQEEKNAAKGNVREQTGPAPANSRIQRGGFGVPKAEQPKSNIIRGGFGTTAADLAAQEKQPEAWQTKLNQEQTKSKGKSKGGLKKRVRVAILMSVAVSLIGVAAFFIFLPFKMVNLLENLKESASHLAERPTEKRLTYLLTRYLAAKIVAGDNANEFDRYICPSGGIICSVFNTWRINRLEGKLGLTIESNRIGNGQATSWKITTANRIEISGDGGDINQIVEQIEKEINGNREMRQFIRGEMRREFRWYNAMVWHGERKMLMRKYGVRSWRGPEKVERGLDSYTDFKRKVRLALKKRLSLASLGRVTKNAAKYIGCLMGGGDGTCKNLQTDEVPIPSEPEPPGGSESDKAARQAANQGQAQIGSDSSAIDVNQVIDEAAASGGTADEVAKEVQKIITRRILAAGVAGIGIVDLLANVVEKIDQGAVNAIAENKNEIAYVGYATEIATAVDKLKAGELDSENVQAMGEIFNNYEKSPFAQHEMETAATLGQAGHEVQRDCDGDGKVEALQPGEYLCPNKKVTADKTAFITSFPAWDAVIVPIANAWNSSVGAVFDFFNDIAGGILNAIGFNKLMEWVISVTGLKGLLESVMATVVNTFFGSPVTGAEEEGDAYDATSIGVKAMYNGMLKNGVDQQGNGMGLGGRPLAPAEIAAINSAATHDRAENFKSQPLLARLFNPNLSGSAAHTLIARTPTNLSNLALTPFNQLASMFTVTASAYPFRNENPTGLVIYGYPENSDVYNKPPETYTEETCKQMAAARDASYGINRDAGEISPRYHLEDPCAMERVVRISAAAKYTDEYNDEFKLYQNQPTGQESGNFTGKPGLTITKGSGWSLQNSTDYSETPCAPGSTETGMYIHPKNGYKIRLCKVDGTGIIVASLVSSNVRKMVDDSIAAGVDLLGNGITAAFRSYEAQIETRKRNGCPADPTAPSSSCTGAPTAPPGQSEHERGLAIDFSTGTASISKGSPQFNWLQGNAAKYGFYNLPREAWHWSTSGA